MGKQIRMGKYGKRPRIAIRFDAATISPVGRRAERLDSMAAKIEASIERAQEYRTALITVAEMGKIDVRGVAA
jgi:hypothetical protein